MGHTFLPDLPEGYHWQLSDEGGNEITGDYYAEPDAVEARVWPEGGDEPVIVLKRTGDYGFWGTDGLRKWAITSAYRPDGLYEWEQFETLAEVARRAKFEPVEV